MVGEVPAESMIKLTPLTLELGGKAACAHNERVVHAEKIALGGDRSEQHGYGDEYACAARRAA